MAHDMWRVMNPPRLSQTSSQGARVESWVKKVCDHNLASSETKHEVVIHSQELQGHPPRPNLCISVWADGSQAV